MESLVQKWFKKLTITGNYFRKNNSIWIILRTLPQNLPSADLYIWIYCIKIKSYHFLPSLLLFKSHINKTYCKLLTSVRTNFLPVTHYCLLVSRHSLLVTFYSLLVTFYSLLLTRYSLLFTCYSLLFTRYLFLFYLLLVPFYSLLVTTFSLLFMRNVSLEKVSTKYFSETPMRKISHKTNS